ncbi:MAG: VCBS repeat-containing protein, partial [Deltaproteobacteria bacterium]|nr:VCBS repeat-containing protein [Deltaproteobacteria bacterium]
MKKTTHGISRFICLMLAQLTLILAVSGPAAAKINRVAVIPFAINAQQDLTFLKNGITDMLISRLSWEGKVTVISTEETEAMLKSFSGPLNESKAREIGARLSADYALFGSLTIFGDSVSMDAKMVDVHQEQPTLSFYNQSQGMGEVIPRINLFAEEINEKVFDRKTTVRQLPAQSPRETPAIYAHPERMLEDGSVQQGAGEGGFSPFVMSRGAEGGVGFWKSKTFGAVIKGFAMGDVDGDGKIEAVLISNSEILIFRYEGDRFLKIKEIPGEKGVEFIAVDVADIKTDGRAEIFVTAHRSSGDIGRGMTQSQSFSSLDSFVLEWNGQDFVPISTGTNWFYRVYVHPQRGTLLLGQSAGGTQIFRPGVHELAWSGGNYVSQGKNASLPGNATVFGLAQGDLTNTGSTAALMFDDEDRLRLFTFSGDQEWKSRERYGGSESFFIVPREIEGGVSVKDPGERRYLSARIIAADLNKDGKTEVVVVKNQALTGRYFDRYRRYNGIQF